MLAAVRVLFLAFLKICLFRKRPQDIPASLALLTNTLVAYAVLSLSLLLVSETFNYAFASVLLDVAILFLFVLLLLKLTGKMERWLQTMTALFGTGVVLSVIALPVYIVMNTFVSSSPDNDPLYSGAVLILACLAVWNIAVMAHVFRNALESGPFTSVMLAISYMWMMLSISTYLFPTELT